MEWTMLSCFLLASFLFIQVEPVISSPKWNRSQYPEPDPVNSSIPERQGALLQLKDYVDQGNALLKDRLTESYTNLKELLKEGDSVLKDQLVQGVAQVKKQRKEGDERLQEELDDDMAWLKDKVDKGQTRMKEDMAEEESKMEEELAEQKEALRRLKDSVQQRSRSGGAVADGDLGQQMADFRAELQSTQEKVNSMEQELQRAREQLQTAEEEIFSLKVRVNSTESCCHSLLESSKMNSSAGARKVSCDEGYERVCNRCLKAVDDEENYSSARQDCGDMGGHLAIARSPGDIDCLWNFRNDKGFRRTWLGADDMQEPGVFRWNDETLLPDDSPMWKSDGEPDKHVHGDTCVYLNPDSSDLYDFPCSNTYQYICQKDPI